MPDADNSIMTIQPSIAPPLLAWYGEHGRHDLPWRLSRDPYRLWLAEVMLQQTQVETVLPYYERFLDRFPTLAALSRASLDEVLALWSGLGYYARARNLHTAARRVMDTHGGAIPETPEELERLPGIGRSTAAAIATSAFGQAAPILDANARRVLLRYHALRDDPRRSATISRLWALASRHTPGDGAAHDYNQAIQDLGALLCRPRRPNCADCPLASGCAAHALGLAESLPAKTPRAAKPLRRAWFALIEDSDGRVLLERRPPSGLWGGLWTLPELPREGDDDVAAVDQFARRLGLDLRLLERWEGGRHTFTHFTLCYETLWCRARAAGVRDDASLTWAEPGASTAMGLARPVTRLLQVLRSKKIGYDDTQV